MRRLADIRVQKLFLVVLVLKVLSSGIGWYFRLAWSFGFAIPLLLMSGYIALGLRRRADDVSDEKFADTCYYLGFIFTITSIIFSLFDLPSIGTQIENIAVRFGAAMVSTVLGLGVRVYLVSFERDAGDATRDAEDAVIDASHRFREQLDISVERLRDFQSEVELASKATVERVNLQIEALARTHADKLAAFFADLTARNQQAFTDSLGEVTAASARLAEFVDGYSSMMRTHLNAMQQYVSGYTDTLLERLRTTVFPDDYFARHMNGPLRQLKGASQDVADSVRQTAAAVSRSSITLLATMKRLRERTSDVEGSLDTVAQLATQQERVLHATEGQLAALQRVATTLSGFGASMEKTAAGIEVGNVAAHEIAQRVGEGSAASGAAANTLARMAKVDVEAAAHLAALARQAEDAMRKADDAAVQMQAMVRQLAALESALAAFRPAGAPDLPTPPPTPAPTAPQD